MEFSYQYTETMSRLGSRLDRIQQFYSYASDARDVNAYSVLVQVDLSQTLEIPIFLFDSVTQYLTNPDTKKDVIVAPLYVDPNNHRECSGAETILRWFARIHTRLSKVNTPKGDIYYGNTGLILDRDFNPLLISTAKILEPNYQISEYVIHINPKVFINDTDTLCKSLARKGVPYYLSNSVTNWRTATGTPYKVVIDNCSEFVIKPSSPNLENYNNQALLDTVKDNIDDVLRQVADDYRRISY